jgi:outer membrane protein assembly factor BamB
LIDDINPVNLRAQHQSLSRRLAPDEAKIPEDSFVPQTHKFFGQGLIEKFFVTPKDAGNAGGTVSQGPAQAPQMQATSAGPAQPPENVSLKGAASQILTPQKRAGEKAWTLKFDHERVRYFHHGDGPVIARCHGGDSSPGIKSLDLQNAGKPLWSYDCAVESMSDPFIGKDLIAFGEKGKGVIALDSGTGKEVRRFPTEGEVQYSPFIDDRGRLFCADSSGQVYAFDSQSGELLWSRDMGDRKPSEKTLVVDNMVIFRDSEGVVHGIDGDRGKKRWKFKTGGCQYYRPIEGGSSGLIYTRMENELNTLLAIDAKNGKLRWKADTERWIEFYSTGEDTLYLGAGKSLSAINGATGDKKWEITSPGGDFKHPPTAAPDGHLYVHNEFTQGLYDLSNPDLDAVICIEPQSGNIDWVTHFPRYGPLYQDSPIPCGENLICLPSLHGDVLTGFSLPEKVKLDAAENQDGEESRITVSDDQDFVDVDGIRLPRNTMNHFALKRFAS